MSQWYYCKDGKTTQGPVTLDALRNMLALGQLQPNSLVQQEGAGKWVRVKHVKELADAGSAAPPPDLEEPGPDSYRARARTVARPAAPTGEQDPWQFRAMRVCAWIAMTLGILFFLAMTAFAIYFFVELVDRRGFRADSVLPFLAYMLGALLCLYGMVSTAILLYFWVEVGRMLRDIRRVVLKHDGKGTA